MDEQPTAPGFYWACVFGRWQPVELMPLGEVMQIGWAGECGECDVVTVWGDRIERAPTVPVCSTCDDTRRVIARFDGSGLWPHVAGAPITATPRSHGSVNMWIVDLGQVAPCHSCSAHELPDPEPKAPGLSDGEADAITKVMGGEHG